MAQKILIIDDEKDVCQTLQAFLTKNGFHVSMANDGLKGLEVAEAEIPDLIILDINMPNMGGVEFYEKICDDEQPKYPIFVSTGRADMEKMFMELNVAGFIAKPYSPQQILDEIKAVFQDRDAGKVKVGKDVFIVESDANVLEDIEAMFKNDGYAVRTSASGIEAIEEMIGLQPDIALVALNLDDIPGDLLVLRLYQMAKTAKINCVLYTPDKSSLQAKQILQTVSQKTNVTTLIEYINPAEILKSVNEAFRLG